MFVGIVSQLSMNIHEMKEGSFLKMHCPRSGLLMNELESRIASGLFSCHYSHSNTPFQTSLLGESFVLLHGSHLIPASSYSELLKPPKYRELQRFDSLYDCCHCNEKLPLSPQ